MTKVQAVDFFFLTVPEKIIYKPPSPRLRPAGEWSGN